MAYSVIPKMRRDATITLKDGTGTPVSLEIEFEEGNFTFTPTKPEQVVYMTATPYPTSGRDPIRRARVVHLLYTSDNSPMEAKRDQLLIL